MSNKDYLDNDLIQRRDSVQEVRMGPAELAQPSAPPHSEAVPVQDLNLTPLLQRKEEINGKVASKMDELERLRSRQQALENEKTSLEKLRANQEKYEAGKREMIDRLEQSLVTLDRAEIAATRRLELLTETEKQCKDLLAGIRGIDEDAWPADSNGYREELTRALALMDSTRKEYNKALARVDVLQDKTSDGSNGRTSLADSIFSMAGTPKFTIAHYIKIGFAVSLPVALMLAVLIGVLLYKLS